MESVQESINIFIIYMLSKILKKCLGSVKMLHFSENKDVKSCSRPVYLLFAEISNQKNFKNNK